MRQELAWGTAAAMAIVAAVGISSQSGGKPETRESTGRQSAKTVVLTKTPGKKTPEKGPESQCTDSVALIEHFFLHEKITGPASCYAEQPAAMPLDPKYRTNFIIATFPDPLHTHFSLLFDRFIEAIQQGAQDEGYEYDSSWLPWETEERSFSSLKDQDEADDRTDQREDQAGILLFRGSGSSPYQNALIVFIVGEESTRGIHRPQFENAVAWIHALQPNGKRTSVAILGPTFSGSFPSLSQLLARTAGLDSLDPEVQFPIYSGSASSRDDGLAFADNSRVQFRSFVQDDATQLDRVCRYFEAKHLSNLAILSEDETAYGYYVVSKEKPSAEKSRSSDGISHAICPDATKIYYPRDISTLRAAYQTQSMFKSGSDQLNQDNTQRKSLPTDLADPAGHQHDTVRTYAGNQTPLSQEAQLLGIVDVLRAHRAEYVILRSSNTLDPLFLANFLRRDYPEARILVLNSDLLFQRGQDAMALGGVMTLSTYPLFSWAREWSAVPPYDVHSHRVFPENSTEGSYIASRLLLQTLARANGSTPALNCEFPDREVFVPPLRCQVAPSHSDTGGKSETSDESIAYAPLPDYSPPFWTDTNACDPTTSALRCRPAVWLSVIKRNSTWPLAALNEKTLDLTATGTSEFPRQSAEHQSWPATPRSTKIAFVALCGLAVFQLLCCRFASFTAKPAFRAHFATADPRHTWLVLIGSYLIALMTLFMAWCCGIFSITPSPPAHNWEIWITVIFVYIVTGAAVLTNIVVTSRLNGIAVNASSTRSRMIVCVVLFNVLIAAFFLLWVWPIEGTMMLANRAFIYWRSMNLTSGVSPVVPFLSLAAGLYIWFWYALHGLALFGPDRPCLPPRMKLRVAIPDKAPVKGPLVLSMFSQQNAAEPAERIAKPLAYGNIIAILILFALLALLMFGFGRGVPIRNLGATQGTSYSRIFCLALVFYCSFVLSQGWQLWRTWSRARQLLVFLDRLPLRRTLTALQGFSWGTVWKMSGNVLDVRYKLLSRQLECLNHLHTSLRLFKVPGDAEEQKAFSGVETCKKSVAMTHIAGLRFAEWYSANYNNPDAGDLRNFELFQKRVANTTGVVLSKLLLPASRTEDHSLIQVDADKGEEDRKGPSPSKNELIRNAEELVCLTYLGFTQNLLGRIRTIVLGGIYLFIALTIAVSSYPFDPRTLLSGILLFLFVAFGGMVVFTYADMHRDATLSHVTNTKPGELGSEFWLKILGYGAAPLLGLITQVFPEWSGFLFSWLQPGLSSLK